MPKPAEPLVELEEHCYTVPELAFLWRCDASELRKRCAAGEFPRAWKLGNDWRVPASDANAWRRSRSPFLTDSAA